MIPQRQPAGNASGRFAADAGGPPPARPPCARGRAGGRGTVNLAFRGAARQDAIPNVSWRLKGRPSTLDKPVESLQGRRRCEERGMRGGAWPRRAKRAAVRALGSVAASFRLAVGPDNIDALDLEGLATALDRPVDKPARPEPQADCRVGRPNRMMKRRHSCFTDPGRAAFPSDADLHRRRFPPQWRYRENHSTESTAPPQAARTLPDGQERITQGSTARQGRKALSSGRQSRENRQLDDERLSISLSECLATAPNHPAAEPISTHKS